MRRVHGPILYVNKPLSSSRSDTHTYSSLSDRNLPVLLHRVLISCDGYVPCLRSWTAPSIFPKSWRSPSCPSLLLQHGIGSRSRRDLPTGAYPGLLVLVRPLSLDFSGSPRLPRVLP